MNKYSPPTLRQKIKLYTLALKFITENISVNFVNDNSSCICDALYRAQIELKYFRETSMYGRVVRWSRGEAIKSFHYNEGQYYDCIQHNFPELLRHKPKNTLKIFWWSYKTVEGSTARIEVIKDILTELKAELSIDKTKL